MCSPVFHIFAQSEKKGKTNAILQRPGNNQMLFYKQHTHTNLKKTFLVFYVKCQLFPLLTNYPFHQTSGHLLRQFPKLLLSFFHSEDKLDKYGIQFSMKNWLYNCLWSLSIINKINIEQNPTFFFVCFTKIITALQSIFWDCIFLKHIYKNSYFQILTY